jgi:myo-inositol-1(or 4)-monophosphatase
LKAALAIATEAARAAGALIRRHLARPKRVTESTRHDIKLELDLRSQRLIASILRRGLPEAPILGEEGSVGEIAGSLRWVVDPIDGTVNFTYGIPHACVSIALQEQADLPSSPTGAVYADGYQTVLGIVYDPFLDELWSAAAQGPARLNGRVIHTSDRRRLHEAIVALGFAKDRNTLQRMLPIFGRLVHRVRKIRIMGAAALSMTYVANGRFDAYVERGVRLWDIAAGGLILQRAGGVFWRRPIARAQRYEMIVSSAALQTALHRLNNEPIE